jgi:hypothetical protein
MKLKKNPEKRRIYKKDPVIFEGKRVKHGLRLEARKREKFV